MSTPSNNTNITKNSTIISIATKVPLRSWIMLLVATLGSFMFYLDRQTLAILKTTISGAMGFDSTDFATIVTAYMIAYTICYLFSGRLIDKWGSRKGASIFLLGMGIATLGCALAQNKGQLMAARGLLGITESGISPATILLMTLWFPAARRAFALTSYHALSAIAPIAAPPVIAMLAAGGEWRICFVIPAILSVIVACIWWSADRNPPFAGIPATGASATGAVSPAQQNDKARPGFFEVFSMIFRMPRLRGIVLARIISDPFYFFMINWHVGFLQEHWHWDIKMVGHFTWIPWVIIPLVNMGAAFLSDRRAASSGDPAGSRSFALRCFACLAPAAALAPFISGSPAIVIPLITLSFLMTNGWNALSGVMVSELAPRGTIATCIGILSALSGFASMAFNQIAGVLVDNFGYTLLFVVGALLHPLAGLVLWLSERSKAPAAPPSTPPATTAIASV